MTPNEGFLYFLLVGQMLVTAATYLIIRHYFLWLERRTFLRSEGLPMTMKYRDEEK